MALREMTIKRFAQVPVDILESLISMAHSHVEDINSGIEDGTYSKSENSDIVRKVAHIASAEQSLLGASPRMLDFINVKVSKPSEGQEVEVLRLLDSKQSNGCRHEISMTEFCNGDFLSDVINGPGRLRDYLPSGIVTHWRNADGTTESEALKAAQEAKRICDILESE